MKSREAESGMPVRVTHLKGTAGMSIAKTYIDARRVNATGKLHAHVPGHGGDVWYVQHDDKSRAVYACSELEPVEATSS